MQAMFGQAPPIQRRSTAAVRWPDRAICQAISLPAVPLPRTRTSKRSACGMCLLRWLTSRVVGATQSAVSARSHFTAPIALLLGQRDRGLRRGRGAVRGDGCRSTEKPNDLVGHLGGGFTDLDCERVLAR